MLRRITLMNPSQMALMVAAASLCACGAEEEQAATACRSAIRWHLVDPKGAEFLMRALERRADGYEVRVTVKAACLDGERRESDVTCRTDRSFQVVDLSD